MAETTEQRRRVMFRYEPKDYPMLDDWLDQQENKSQSIVYALEMLITQIGSTADTDIIKNALKQSTQSSIELLEQKKTDWGDES
ncbi:hypothetical protein CAR_50p220 (plasmid) [Carnobacterium sp. 17-4]|uniref:hypothetical protein n=1 Tax=Carnobacterium sp. (strain 17-4) TaxID=208596 RepID=UPI0002058490|nr:hypothetical protein [Carnobacterium sp. 17-4]AEB31194.1 hypothetical protein CAR_50p220 [Carnobacterium sp. 17-4]